MKANLYRKYGSADVLQLEEIEKPAPRDDEVLIKVHEPGTRKVRGQFSEGSGFGVSSHIAHLQRPCASASLTRFHYSHGHDTLYCSQRES